MKPIGEVLLDVLKGDKDHSLKFQVLESSAKPLLSAETCQNLGLLRETVDGHVRENICNI